MTEKASINNQASVMISYSRKDQDFVRALHSGLLGHGLSESDIWVDWDNIPLSADWMKEITKGIQDTNAFLFIISPDSVVSEVCKEEIRIAAESNKRFIPILYREPGKNVELHPLISSHNWIIIPDESKLESSLPNLIQVLNTDLDWVTEHTRLFIRASEWDRNDRDASYLLRDSDQRKGDAFLDQGATGKEPNPTQLHVEYIQAGRKFAEILRRRNRIISGIVGVVLTVLTIFALIQRGDAVENSHIAQTQEGIALTQEGIALENYRIAQTQEAIAVDAQLEAELQTRIWTSLGLASEAINQMDNDAQLALMLALLSAQETKPDGIVLQETKTALFTVLNSPNVLQTFEHEDMVFSVAYDSQNKYFATGTWDGGIHIWSVETGALLHSGKHEDAVFRLDFSPDGKQLGSASWDGTAKVWDVASGKEIFTLTSDPVQLYDIRTQEYYTQTQMYDIDFSPDGKLIATGGFDNIIRLWNAETGTKLRTLIGHADTVKGLDFSPDSRTLISGSADGTARLWDAQSGNLLRTFYAQGDDFPEVTSVTFNSEGDRILVGTDNKFGFVWDVNSGKLIQTLIGNVSSVFSVAYHPDDGTMITSSTNAKIWETYAGYEQYSLAAHNGEILSVTYNGDGSKILTGSTDHTAKLWSNDLPIDSLIMKDQRDQILEVAYSADGKRIATGGGTGDVIVYDAESGEILDRYSVGSEGFVFGLSFDPQDSNRIVTGSRYGLVQVWSSGKEDPVLEIQAHELNQFIYSTCFSPDGSMILSASNDGLARLWDAYTGELLLELDGHAGLPVYDAKFSSDGSLILTGGGDMQAHIWDIETGEKVSSFLGHTDWIHEVQFNSDSSRIYTASEDDTVKIWDVSTGDVLLTLAGHTSTIFSLDLSPDEKMLATGSFDTTVKIWDLTTGKEILNYAGNNEETTAVAFSPDGSSVLTAGLDSTAKVFTIDYEELLKAAQLYELQPLTPEECLRFLKKNNCTLTLFD